MSKPARPRKTSSGSPAKLHDRYDVIIVGGGMIGGTLAASLGRLGLDILLLDRLEPDVALEAPFDGRASAIAYGSQRILDGVGIWSGMAHAAQPILDIRVSDGASPLFLHYDHRAAGEQFAGAPFGWIVENLALRRAIDAALDGIRNVTRVAPAQALDVALRPGHIGVRVLDEAGKRSRDIDATLLVGADGRNSSLRKRFGIAVTEWAYPQTAIVCTMGHERPHRGIAHERFLTSGPFAVLPMVDDPLAPDPLARHRSSIVWTERTAQAPHYLALDDAQFSAELAQRFGAYYGDVKLLGRRWSYPLSLMHAETYVRPRAALIGDAAHAIHPIAGQGLNMGLRDVAALAESIADAARLGLDIGAEDVLVRYQRWRRFDNVALAAVTDALNRLFSNDVAPVRIARDVGLAAVNKLPPVKRFFMRHAMGMTGKLPRLMKGERL
ncbi:MAG: UbiH/UbiF/VisC/COQ6 family ubiquinone biosynthesis hydroxylase [Alphaproteobacteria bacterium]